MAIAYNISPPGFSWVVALTLAAVVMMSLAVFWALVHRWTNDIQRAALSDWARQHGFRREVAAQSPLNEATRDPLHVTISLSDGHTSLMQLSDDESPPQRWNALVATLQSSWKPTALRPTHAPGSLLDLVSLSSYPLMGETDRFVIFGTETASARRLSKSQARGLLPPDIGLLLHGTHLILDFSTRPFDPIELERMIALAEQLLAHLPN